MRIYILLAFLIISCSKDVILEQGTKSLKGDNFYNALASGYNELAKREREQFDWIDTDIFAKKGINALKRRYVEVEDPLYREIPDNFVLDELIAARNALTDIFALNDGMVRFEHGLRAARLQILYDYWVEQAEENWQDEEISRFRDEFWASYNSLYAAIQLAKIEKREEVLAKNYFTIYFDHGIYVLDKTGNEIVNNVIYRAFNKGDNFSIVLEGHTDLSGSREFNEKLAKKRIASVKSALISAGIKEEAIVKEEVFGQDKPKIVKEAGGYRDRENRRVEIYVIDKKLW